MFVQQMRYCVKQFTYDIAILCRSAMSDSRTIHVPFYKYRLFYSVSISPLDQQIMQDLSIYLIYFKKFQFNKICSVTFECNIFGSIFYFIIGGFSQVPILIWLKDDYWQ